MQIEEANGLNTLDNISIMLCGDGISELGKMSYDPSRGTIWSDATSFVTPLSVQTMQVSSDITQLSMIFEVSWDFPWEDNQNSCCLLYTSPSPRDLSTSRMPSSA